MMKYEIRRTDAEIDEQLDRAWEAEGQGSRYSGMTFEDGVREAIDWLTTEGGDGPPLPEK